MCNLMCRRKLYFQYLNVQKKILQNQCQQVPRENFQFMIRKLNDIRITQPHVTLEKKIFQIYFQIIETITFNEEKTDYKRIRLNFTIMIVVV